MIANLILFALSSGILFYVVKYRIHVYVSYEPRNPPAKTTRARPSPTIDTDINQVLTHTLIRLGAKPRMAREAIGRAIANSTSQEFNEILKVAIQECHRMAPV